MVASGNPKSLNDLAPTNGKADHGGFSMIYPVKDQNYGENVLGCDDAVSFATQDTNRCLTSCLHIVGLGILLRLRPFCMKVALKYIHITTA